MAVMIDERVAGGRPSRPVKVEVNGASLSRLAMLVAGLGK